MAESQGFEPWVPFGTQHFECCTFDHSDNSPCMLHLKSHKKPRAELQGRAMQYSLFLHRHKALKAGAFDADKTDSLHGHFDTLPASYNQLEKYAARFQETLLPDFLSAAFQTQWNLFIISASPYNFNPVFAEKAGPICQRLINKYFRKHKIC